MNASICSIYFASDIFHSQLTAKEKKEHFKSCAQILYAVKQFLLKAPISMIDISPCKMNTTKMVVL